jgi:hypothetical protein
MKRFLILPLVLVFSAACATPTAPPRTDAPTGTAVAGITFNVAASDDTAKLGIARWHSVIEQKSGAIVFDGASSSGRILFSTGFRTDDDGNHVIEDYIGKGKLVFDGKGRVQSNTLAKSWAAPAKALGLDWGSQTNLKGQEISAAGAQISKFASIVVGSVALADPKATSIGTDGATAAKSVATAVGDFPSHSVLHALVAPGVSGASTALQQQMQQIQTSIQAQQGQNAQTTSALMQMMQQMMGQGSNNGASANGGGATPESSTDPSSGSTQPANPSNDQTPTDPSAGDSTQPTDPGGDFGGSVPGAGGDAVDFPDSTGSSSSDLDTQSPDTGEVAEAFRAAHTAAHASTCKGTLKSKTTGVVVCSRY